LIIGGCGCSHGHVDDGNELGAHYTLFQKIDLGNVVCLNEETDGSGKTIFKSWSERLCRQKVKSAYPSTVKVKEFCKCGR